MKRVAWLCTLALALTGCAVGPNYKRPAVDTPAQFRGDTAPAGSTESLGDTQWANLFQDEVITNLVQTALRDNYDARIAAERVLEARAQLGISVSQLYPALSGSGGITSTRQSSIGSITFIPRGTNLTSTYEQLGFVLNWELDLWGRIRRMNEAARAQYLGSDEARRGVTTTLVGDTIATYFQLLEFDLDLDIAKKTRDAGDRGLKLTSLRHDRGVATGLDVRQAEQLLYIATAQIASAERSIGQTENALSVLVGSNPREIQRGKPLEAFQTVAQVPAGLPSSLLERRPDIRQAEQNLIAANAEIGAAKAQYFPQIALTGFLGGQSRALTSLFTGPGRDWNFAPTATFPIFNAGRIRNNVRLTEAQQREAALTYQKTIQTGFREVSDALIGYRKTSEQRVQQELLVKALDETDRLSKLRYQGGLDSYLQVLDAERNLFSGQLVLAQLRRSELQSIVQLYRSLGGGWQ